jgi:hypothetical protein
MRKWEGKNGKKANLPGRQVSNIEGRNFIGLTLLFPTSAFPIPNSPYLSPSILFLVPCALRRVPFFARQAPCAQPLALCALLLAHKPAIRPTPFSYNQSEIRNRISRTSHPVPRNSQPETRTPHLATRTSYPATRTPFIYHTNNDRHYSLAVVPASLLWLPEALSGGLNRICSTCR